MSEHPKNKPSTLSLKPRKSEQTKSSKPAGAGQSVKSGARAHQKTRLATEALRAQKPTPAAIKPERAASRSRPGSGSARSRSDSGLERQTKTAPTPQPRIDHQQRFKFFASCPRGLEQVLAKELTDIGLAAVQGAQAGCKFQGNWSDVWRANLYSRLATRILVQIAHANIRGEDDLRALALQTPWEQWLGAEKTLRVDTSAIRSPMKSLQYCNLLVKDSICDRLRDKEGARPSIDTVRPDVRVHSFLAADSATLYLDTSGESLFKRGWRFDKAQAPIRENLAAGLLALSGWQPNEPLLDPFCGSATILIEAAWQALNIPPGINRPFAFERLRAHEPQAWQAMRQDATEAILSKLPAPISGCDVSPQAIEAARANMKRAGLNDDAIELKVANACEISAPEPRGMIITNPPYGERLELDPELMLQWAAQLKQQFTNWNVNVISADHSLPSAMHLKPKRKVPLFNGALDCRLFLFEIVPLQYNPQKSSG